MDSMVFPFLLLCPVPAFAPHFFVPLPATLCECVALFGAFASLSLNLDLPSLVNLIVAGDSAFQRFWICDRAN